MTHIEHGDILVGEPGRDLLIGTSSNEIIYTYAGHDQVYGRSGDDLILSARGEDRIYTRLGYDSVLADGENNTVSAGGGTHGIFQEGGYNQDDRIIPDLTSLDNIEDVSGFKGLIYSGYATNAAQVDAAQNLFYNIDVQLFFDLDHIREHPDTDATPRTNPLTILDWSTDTDLSAGAKVSIELDLENKNDKTCGIPVDLTFLFKPMLCERREHQRDV